MSVGDGQMTPKRAHRMIDEIYKKSKLDDRIHHPLSYALYEVWKLSETEDIEKEQRYMKRSKNE